MKKKIDIYKIFDIWKMKVKTETEKKLKIVQSDNDEYQDHAELVMQIG